MTTKIDGNMAGPAFIQTSSGRRVVAGRWRVEDGRISISLTLIPAGGVVFLTGIEHALEPSGPGSDGDPTKPKTL